MPDALADLLALGLCCPRCRGDLACSVQHGEGTLRCGSCGQTYPVTLGIPDLRVFADPYIDSEADRAKGRRLKEEGGRTWEDQVRFYYAITESVPAAQASRFVAGLQVASARAEATIAAWEALDPRRAPAARLLDVGCGTAPLLVASGSRAGVRVGVDIAFRWLVVGQQRLADAGVTAHLVCACAEALPFRGGQFDLVESQGLLENVRDQEQTMAEARRVMEAGGQLRVSTANRFSPGPDPHLGLPGGGLVPAGIAAAMARRRGALPPVRRLLSLRTLAGLLRRGGFGQRRYGVPIVAEAQRRNLGLVLRAAARGYEWARLRPGVRQLLLLVSPTLVATARKSAPQRSAV